MTNPMIPYPFMNDVEKMREGERRYGDRRAIEIKNASQEKCRCGHSHDGDVCDDCDCRIFVKA